MNNTTPDLSGLLNAMGALSELLWLFYSNLVKQGFSPSDALQLTNDFMIRVFAEGGSNT